MSAPTEMAADTPTDHFHQLAAPEAGGLGTTAAMGWAGFVGASLRPFWGRFSLLAALLLGGIALELAAPQFVRAFIDAATHAASGAVLLPIALAALSIALVSQVAMAASTFVGQDVGWAATNRLRELLARHLLGLDMRYHKAHLPGEFIERIDGDLTNLSTFFSILMIQVVGSGVLLLGTLVVLIVTDWRVGLGMGVYIVGATALLLRIRSVAIPAGVQERESSATFLGFLEERLAGVEDIRANGGGAYVMDRFYHSMRHWFARTVDAWNRRSRTWTATNLLLALGITLTLGLSAYFYQTHRITLGTAYLFYQYILMVQGPIERITQQLQEFQKAASSLIRVRELLRLEPAIQDGPQALMVAAAQPAHAAPLAVRFEHVTFTYEVDEAAVLRDLDFALEPGKVLGLLGRTGSGKTSLSRLLFRLYDVTEGAVRLDGVDVRDLALATLRQRVGVVTQDVQLFQATVRDNLTFFDPRISDARILGVIAEMGLTDWLTRLPAGLDTPLESGGGGLSAGEAQLLAFVRVFLRDPGLVILDEPSSRLDLATERLIERGVSTLLCGRTGIIIAHRLATVRRADLIMTLGDGRVLEYGPRAALERDPASRFYALLRVGLEEVLA